MTASSNDKNDDNSSSSSGSSEFSSSSATSSSSSVSLSLSMFIPRPRIPEFLRQRRQRSGGDDSESAISCRPTKMNVGYRNEDLETKSNTKKNTAAAAASQQRPQCPYPSLSLHKKKKWLIFIIIIIIGVLVFVFHLALYQEDEDFYNDLVPMIGGDGVQKRNHGEGMEGMRRNPSLRRPQSNSVNNFWNQNKNNNDKNDDDDEQRQTTRRKPNLEEMPEGCAFLQDWQTISFPNCNQMHEIDLAQHLKLVPLKQQPNTQQQQTSTSTSTSKLHQESYLASGLWRDVFSIIPDGDPGSNGTDTTRTSVVMKLMKTEHPVDPRNWDRHRRDALTMERLTSSPNVVDIYAYCGNTVVTEHAPMDLEAYLQKKKKNTKQTMQNDLSRLTLFRKLQIALDTARAIAAVHSVDVIHADVQTKQFLVDAQGTVKINDFNRCRFLPRHNDSTSNTTICPIRIPSAPGLWRSPEEYLAMPVMTAMDVYSLGNVLHHILVGEEPFKGQKGTAIKQQVTSGMRPEINLQGADASTRRLAALIQWCLEKDADKRITAVDLVRELEVLLLAAENEGENYTP